MDDIQHYNQTPKRKAEFITPLNTLKAKVGTGGLNERIIERAQMLLESHAADFAPLAESYLAQMQDSLNMIEVKNFENISEEDLNKILLPCMQLKANGQMFHYPLITHISDRYIQFIEVIDEMDKEIFEISGAFHTTLKMIIAGKIKGDGGVQGKQLVEALHEACMRYFKQNKAAKR